MPKSLAILIPLILAIAGTAIGFYAPKKVPINFPQIKEQEKNNFIDPIISRVNAMSLDEKLGQMLIIGFEHTYLDKHAKKMIVQYHIGGVNLLGRNAQKRDQIKKLTTNLQKIAKIPLFIATDQEGGKFNRFKFFHELTPQIKISRNKQAEQIAFDRAKELVGIGVNMNFSPLLDYVSDTKAYLYSRTFAVDAPTTGDLGGAMIRGYLKGGVIPVAKHFPGYGNISLDPHRNTARLKTNNSELEQSLTPFRKIIADHPVMAIMTAHIIIPEVDNKPATISSRFVSKILREELGFNGVVITDDIEMISAGNAPIEQLAVDAVKAGVDIIISTYTPEKQIKIFNRLKKAVLDKEIAETMIDKSVIRILNLKSVMLLKGN